MNTRTTLWLCHNPACGLRGDAVTFLTAFHGLDEAQAQRVLEERYGGPERSVEAGGLLAEVERIMGDAEDEEELRVVPGPEWLERFRVGWRNVSPTNYVFERGFTVETLTDWDIGWDSISDRITIPWHDEYGRLVGFKARATRDHQSPKYILLGDAPGRQERYGFNTFRKSLHVFGLDRAQGDRVTVCEGEFNAIMLHQHGEHGAVSVAGSEFSQRQAELIIKRFKSAVVYFDGDDAGRHGISLVVEALSPYMPVSVVVDPPDDAAALGAHALPLIAAAVPSLTVAIRGSNM